MTFEKYTIQHDTIDWSSALIPWHQSLPQEFTLWFVNSFCDLFIAEDNGRVWRLSMDTENLDQLAKSRKEFCQLVDENANEWLLVSLVEKLRKAGISLSSGQCYGFKLPPVLGGEYVRENVAVKSTVEYLQFCAEVHKQIEDVPDGTPVTIQVVG